MGFPATTPETVLVTRLDTVSTPVALTSGTNLFAGPERPPAPEAGMPHQAVFARQYSASTSPDMGVATDDRFYRLQVLVRGNPDQRAETIALANACLAVCDRNDPSDAGYVWLTSREGGWTDLGVDDTEHPRLSFNVELTFSG